MIQNNASSPSTTSYQASHEHFTRILSDPSDFPRGFGNLDSQEAHTKSLLHSCKSPLHTEITAHIQTESSISRLSTSHGSDLKKKEIQGRSRGNINPVTTGMIYNGRRIFTIFWSIYFYEWIFSHSYPRDLTSPFLFKFSHMVQRFLELHLVSISQISWGCWRLKENGGFKHFSG